MVELLEVPEHQLVGVGAVVVSIDAEVPQVGPAVGAEAVGDTDARLTVDGAQAGVGGIDSWGSLPLPQHRADAQCGGKCEWSFVLRPFSRGDGTIEEMAAEAKDRPNFEPLQLDES